MRASRLGNGIWVRHKAVATRAAVGLLAGVVALVAGSPGSAEAAPQPARKDSRLARPRQIHLSTSVVPATARPGQTVTYRITATVDDPWHIYALVKKQKDEGPRGTEIDLFDTAGLRVAGDWKASKPAVRHKDDAFPDLDFVEYHEERVVWSIPLRVPDGMTAGRKTLRSQLFFQLCSKGANASCLPPGRWTLPDATLTVSPRLEAK